MSLKRIAELSSTSVSTVSKAFSNSREVSVEKRQEIFEVAKKLGYYEKYCKPDFDKKVIAVICPEVQGGYYTNQLTLFEKEIKKRDCIMVIASFEFDYDLKMELIKYFSQCAKVDGIIVYSGRKDNNIECGTPIVVIGECTGSDSVVLVNKYAIEQAVEHFLENGHKKIAFIGEKRTMKTCEAFVGALKQHGIEINPDYLIESDERFEQAGYTAMNRLLKLDNPPTAVFAAYDCIAVGAMKSVYEHGGSVPGDVSFIGINDNRENHYLNVPLTSITSFNEDFCEIVTNTLFDRINSNDKVKTKKISVSTELVKRSSVGIAKV